MISASSRQGRLASLRQTVGGHYGIAGLLIQPAVLLAAFVFFWREAKAGRQELRAELKAEMHLMKTRIREDIGKFESRIDRVEVRIDRVGNRIARIEDRMIK